MGEIADWMIEQQIYGLDDFTDDEDFGYVKPKTATDVAEDKLSVAKNGKATALNEGVIKW